MIFSCYFANFWNRFLLLCAVLVTLGLDVRPLSAADDYFPLQDGMEWIMDVQASTPGGKVIPGIAHRKIEGVASKNGKTYFRAHTWMENDQPFPLHYTKLVRRDTKGFHFLEEPATNAVEQTEIPFPIKPGDSWKIQKNGETFTSTVLAREDLKIGNTTYRGCYKIKVESKEQKYEEEFWQAPNFGNIKAVIKAGGGSITLTLKELKTPKPKGR